MHTHAGKLSCFLALAALAGFCGPVGHASPARPGDSVVLLHNGNVLVGRVSLENDRYVVSQPHGVLRMPRRAVRMVCQSLAEAYKAQRAELPPGEDSLIRLIHWGLKHDLLEQCAADLAQIEPKHPHAAVLTRRLAAAKLAASKEGRTIGRDPSVRPASHAEPEKTDRDQTQEDARWLRRVPSEIRSEFVGRVQPILVRGCGAAGCHAPDAGRPFHIDRAAIDGAGHAAVTTANLRRLFELLTEDAEAVAKLVDHAGRPHGKADTRPSRALNARQQSIVAKWVGAVAAEVATSEAAVTVDPGAVSVVPGRVEFQGPTVSGKTASESKESNASAQQPTQPKPQLRFADSLEDPFDPDRFNRRYHPEQ